MNKVEIDITVRMEGVAIKKSTHIPTKLSSLLFAGDIIKDLSFLLNNEEFCDENFKIGEKK